jgi:SAM-dependent methyltransferase
VTATATRHPYDAWAVAYRDYWGRVIESSAVGLLDRLDGLIGPDDRPTILDVGTGIGALAIAALERWPGASVIGVDPAARMLDLVAVEAERRGIDRTGRLETRVGSAERLPLDAASIDVVVSSFVIQLVSSRAAALREIARVLRPGGTFACITWQWDDLAFEPDDVFGDVLEDLGVDTPPGGPDDTRPYTTPEAAAAEVRRAGFRQVNARTEWLEHRYTPESYLAMLENWLETETFRRLGFVRRRQLRQELRRRYRRLPAEDFVWRRPLISVVGTRPTA